MKQKKLGIEEVFVKKDETEGETKDIELHKVEDI